MFCVRDKGKGKKNSGMIGSMAFYSCSLARPEEVQGVPSAENQVMPRQTTKVTNMTEQRAYALIIKISFKTYKKALKIWSMEAKDCHKGMRHSVPSLL